MLTKIRLWWLRKKFQMANEVYEDLINELNNLQRDIAIADVSRKEAIYNYERARHETV